MKTKPILMLALLLGVLLGHEAQAFYNPSTGRWLSRDPAGYASMNCYAFIGNEPVGRNDYLGLWDTRVHLHATKRWALRAGYPSGAAEKVAVADNDVDSRYSYITEPGTQYHFNRSFSMGTWEDTRMVKYREHLLQAKAACTIANGFDFPELAAWQLGTALHPYQDWVAHGDHNYFLIGSFALDLRYRHNYMSPARGSYNFPDDPNLDAVGSPDGRPSLSVLHLVFQDGLTFDYADYVPGHKRYQLTHSMSSSTLTEFREYVRANGGCRCKTYFGVQ